MFCKKILNKETNIASYCYWNTESDVIINSDCIEIPDNGKLYKWENNSLIESVDKIQSDIKLLSDHYDTFPLGVQHQFEWIKKTVISYLSSNEHNKALEVIQTCILPLELEQARQDFVLMLQEVM